MKNLFLILLLPLCVQAQDSTPRMWTNQQGRSVKATLIEVSGVNVVIQLENGAKSTVHVGTLSKADQDYLQRFQSAKPVAGKTANSTEPLIWPQGVISVDPKSIEVIEGVQDEAARQYHYQAGMFDFVSSAPLAKSVMSEVAADFLLTYNVMKMMPWSWEPKPKEGPRFKVMLAETKDDYVRLFGGNDTTSATTVNGNPLINFSALGLKQVGPRYQYDARRKDPGGITYITAYGLIYELRGWLYTWPRYSFPAIIRDFAYQNNGSIKFTELESSLRKYFKMQIESYKVTPDLDRMIKLMRAKNSEVRTDVVELNREVHCDSALLGYYFAFLDRDGSGAGLHEYFRNIMARAGKSQATTTPGLEKATPEELLNKIFAGRDDATLKAEMTEKFKSIGIRFGK
jgi:hypothetical protein